MLSDAEKYMSSVLRRTVCLLVTVMSLGPAGFHFLLLQSNELKTESGAKNRSEAQLKLYFFRITMQPTFHVFQKAMH